MNKPVPLHGNDVIDKGVSTSINVIVPTTAPP